MQDTFVINDVSTILDFVNNSALYIIQDDSNGFLCDYTTFFTEDQSFYVPCDNYDYQDISQNISERFVPYPGEYPVVEAELNEVDGFQLYSLYLSPLSYDAFQSMDKGSYEAWWGINPNKSNQEAPKEKNYTEIISVNRGLYHFADMLQTKEISCSILAHSSFQCNMACTFISYF